MFEERLPDRNLPAVLASIGPRRIGRWIGPWKALELRSTLHALIRAGNRAEDELAEARTQTRKAQAEIRSIRNMLSDEARRAKKDAESIRNRIKVALTELHGGDAQAIVLSPKQVESMSWDSFTRRAIGKIDGVQVYVARGISGPIVMNRDAFAAFSRQAPEMDIRKA